MNYEKEHRKMWHWLASHPSQDKTEYFKAILKPGIRMIFL